VILLCALGLFYATWLFYLAVMNLKRAKDAGTLSTTALVMGYPLLLIGLALDCLLNLTVMTVLLLELPKELLVTARLKRHAPEQTWRGSVARWLAKHLLDTFDPSGKHI